MDGWYFVMFLVGDVNQMKGIWGPSWPVRLGIKKTQMGVPPVIIQVIRPVEYCNLW